MRRLAPPQRGEVYQVDLAPVNGSKINRRLPCVVMSMDVLNQQRHHVVVIPLSPHSSHRPPLVVAVPSMGRSITARIDQIRAVAKERLVGREGKLSEEDMLAVEQSLRTVLNL